MNDFFYPLTSDGLKSLLIHFLLIVILNDNAMYVEAEEQEELLEEFDFGEEELSEEEVDDFEAEIRV